MSDGMPRSQPCMVANASLFAAASPQSSRVESPSIGTSSTSALAISRSSASHQSLPVAGGEIARHVDGEGRRELAHHRQREIAVVAIAVVEGEAGEAAREVALAHPPVHFVEGDDVDVEAADVLERRAQEVGRDFQMSGSAEMRRPGPAGRGAA